MVQAATTVLGDGFEIVTVGTLGGYSQFFLSIAIKGQNAFSIGKLADKKTDDVWSKFFNLNSSHNGLIGSNCMLSTVRIVCMNTVQASINDAETQGTVSTIKHTLNSEALVTPATFEANLTAWLKQSESFQDKLKALKAQKMTVDKFKAFTAGVFTNEGSDELSTNSYNRVEEMVALFQRGQGNNGATRYDALNAFTEFFTSGNGVGNPERVKANKRLATANFGKGNDWKLEAMRALTGEDFAKVCKRGETLYEDKARVMVQDN